MVQTTWRSFIVTSVFWLGFSSLPLFFACATHSYTWKMDRAIKARRKDYRACFDRIYRDASVGTTDGVKLEFILLATGEIKGLKFDSTTPLGQSLSECLRPLIEGLRLPLPEQTTRVQYPFVFTKRKSESDFNF